jgi:hypothetical protein
VVVPAVACAPLHAPLAPQAVALIVVHVNVALAPSKMLAGIAFKLRVGAGNGPGLVGGVGGVVGGAAGAVVGGVVGAVVEGASAAGVAPPEPEQALAMITSAPISGQRHVNGGVRICTVDPEYSLWKCELYASAVSHFEIALICLAPALVSLTIPAKYRPGHCGVALRAKRRRRTIDRIVGRDILDGFRRNPEIGGAAVRDCVDGLRPVRQRKYECCRQNDAARQNSHRWIRPLVAVFHTS